MNKNLPYDLESACALCHKAGRPCTCAPTPDTAATRERTYWGQVADRAKSDRVERARQSRFDNWGDGR